VFFDKRITWYKYISIYLIGTITISLYKTYIKQVNVYDIFKIMSLHDVYEDSSTQLQTY